MLKPTRQTRLGSPAGIIACFVVALATTACERPPPLPGSGRTPQEGDLIVLIGPEQSDPRSAAIAGGARLRIEEYQSLRLETLAPSDNSGGSLSPVVREALAMQPKAICLFVPDADAAQPAVIAALRSGRILVTIGAGSPTTGAFGHVDVGVAAGAELMGEHLTSIAGGKRSYLLAHSRGARPVDTRCYDRFMLSARSEYGMTLLDQRDASESGQAIADLIREMVAQFPHGGLVVTLDPTPWLSVPAKDLLGSEARFATLCAAPVLWPALRSGEAAALVGPLDGQIGSLAIEAALAGITESRRPGLVHFVDNEVVTGETLDNFAARYAQAAGLDVDELLSAAPVHSDAPPKPVVEP